MDPMVVAAGAALVTAMANDGWERAKAGAVALWRRGRADEAATVDRELTEVRAELVEAAAQEDTATPAALVGSWQVKLHRLVRDHPELAADLRRLVDEVLTAAPGTDGPVVTRVEASGHARVYQAGRDLRVTEYGHPGPR